VPTLIFGSLALIFYFRMWGDVAPENQVQPDNRLQSIAVMPLANMSDVAANVFLPRAYTRIF
jgi:hypothetical protein